MNGQGPLELMKSVIWILAQVAGPALVAALIVGLIVGVLQTATQVNESSISFVMKLLAVIGALVFTGPYALATLVDFTRHCITSLAEVVR